MCSGHFYAVVSKEVNIIFLILVLCQSLQFRCRSSPTRRWWLQIKMISFYLLQRWMKKTKHDPIVLMALLKCFQKSRSSWCLIFCLIFVAFCIHSWKMFKSFIGGLINVVRWESAQITRLKPTKVVYGSTSLFIFNPLSLSLCSNIDPAQFMPSDPVSNTHYITSSIWHRCSANSGF